MSLVEYENKRKAVLPFDDLICFIENLLYDTEYYFQKGLGWTLREIYNVYPKRTLKFIESNLSNINPIAYSAATEKVKSKEKGSIV